MAAMGLMVVMVVATLGQAHQKIVTGTVAIYSDNKQK